MLKRAVLVGTLLLCCAITAAGPRSKESARCIKAEYDFEVGSPGIEIVKVQLTVSGPISKPLRATLSGIGDYHVEIETTEVPGDEPQYRTKWQLTERDDSGRIINIVARPQVRSFGNVPAVIDVSDGHGEDRKFKVTVSNSKY